jgi:hypothetical protein
MDYATQTCAVPWIWSGNARAQRTCPPSGGDGVNRDPLLAEERRCLGVALDGIASNGLVQRSLGRHALSERQGGAT